MLVKSWISVFPWLLSVAVCFPAMCAVGGAAVAAHADRPTDAVPSAKEQIEADWIRQEQVSRKLEAGSKEAVDGVLERGRKMIADLKPELPEEAAKAAHVLGRVEKQGRSASNQAQWLALYLEARHALRTLAFSNPLIDFDELLFVKRNTPGRHHQCAHRVGESQRPGANISVLRGLNPEGEVRDLLSGDYTEGGIGRPDLSFDGKRVVFPFARKRADGTPYKHIQFGGSGYCEPYDIYETDITGSEPVQVVDSPKTEDTEPCYLPGGRIAFTSSRGMNFVQCGDWALVNGIYSVKRDGSDVYKITEPQDGEFYPSMLDSGRIMYTRWDYVMKPYNTQQQLWAVNPDGRRAELIYGDWYNFSPGPIAMFEARQIPGTSMLLAIGAAHHNNGAGPIMLVDMNQNRGGPGGMTNLTPEIGYPEIIPEKRKANHKSETGFYNSPYPLGRNHFLAIYTFGPHSVTSYGIYLMDIHGNKELIYQTNSEVSCYAPIPIRARKEPPVIPNLVTGVPEDKPASVIVNDAYLGLLQEGVKRGEIRHLRVVEVSQKKQHTRPQRMDLGVNCGWEIRTVLGTVPVEEDGSVHFELPPHKLILLEALDKDYLEIKRMRNYMNVKQGEAVSCIGCHEPYGMSPPSMAKAPEAVRRAPSKIAPPPFGVRGMSYEHIVQPVLDKHCISCHDGSEGDKRAFSLKSGTLVPAPKGYDKDQGPQHHVSTSFLKLLEYVEYMKAGGYGDHNPAVLVPSKANSPGSRISKLMKLLQKGHHNVELSVDEWRALAAWIDCNAPYYGDFDKIEKVYKKEDDSAKSIAPITHPFAVTDLKVGKGMVIENGQKRFGISAIMAGWL